MLPAHTALPDGTIFFPRSLAINSLAIPYTELVPLAGLSVLKIETRSHEPIKSGSLLVLGPQTRTPVARPSIQVLAPRSDQPRIKEAATHAAALGYRLGIFEPINAVIAD